MTLLLALILAMDLASVKAEPNLEKRSEQALSLADTALSEARDAEAAGKRDLLKSKLGELEDAAEICRDSLDATGKSARRSPKHFKRAEVRLRELLRRIKAFSDSAGFESRDLIDAAYSKVSATRDHILEEIMTKK